MLPALTEKEEIEVRPVLKNPPALSYTGRSAFFPQLSTLSDTPYSFWNSGRQKALSNIRLVEKDILRISGLPFFVVIRITPLAAWLPYKAAAGEPFRILILSTSSGFRLEIPSPPSRFPASAVPPIAEKACSLAELRIGTPSMTYKGWLLPTTERMPRIRTLEELPRPEAALFICTPATFPASVLIIFGSFTRFSSSPSTCSTE